MTPLEALSDAFDRARAAAPDELSERWFCLGGATLRARIVGDALTRILERSLADVPAGDATLTLDLFDERASGVAPGLRTYQHDGIVREGAAKEELGYDAGGRHVYFSGPDFDVRLDRHRDHAVGWLRAAEDLSSWHRARPLQTLFLPWLVGRGLTIVHAAMVARDGIGLLLPGPPHSGKSTTAAACAAAGFEVLGDEAIAIEVREDGIFGHCVHAAVKLRRPALARLPELSGRTHELHSMWQDEVVAFLGEAFPGQVATTARVAAIGFPHLTTGLDTTALPLGAGATLRNLAGAVLSPEPGQVAEQFAVLAEITRRLPAYTVGLGTVPAGVPAGLAVLLAGSNA